MKWRIVLTFMLSAPLVLLATFWLLRVKAEVWPMLALVAVCAGIYMNRADRLARIRSQTARTEFTNKHIRVVSLFSIVAGLAGGLFFNLGLWTGVAAVGTVVGTWTACLVSECVDEEAGKAAPSIRLL